MTDDKKMVLYGKGKEYSEVANEIKDMFKQWLEHSNLSEKQFCEQMNAAEVKIEKKTTENGIIYIYVKTNKVVLAPIIFPPVKNNGYEEYITDAILLLLLAATKCGNKSFEKNVRDFATKTLKNG